MVAKYIIRRLLLTIFLAACLLASQLAALWLMMCIIFAPNGKRGMNIVLSHDQLFNCVTGGDMDEMLSSRATRLSANRRWARMLCKFLNALDKGHCDQSAGV